MKRRELAAKKGPRLIGVPDWYTRSRGTSDWRV